MESQLIFSTTFHNRNFWLWETEWGWGMPNSHRTPEPAHFLTMKKILPVLLLTGLVHQMFQKTAKTTRVYAIQVM